MFRTANPVQSFPVFQCFLGVDSILGSRHNPVTKLYIRLIMSSELRLLE